MSNEGLVSDIKTLLGQGTKFKGVLTFEGIVRIDGEMEGEIISKDILIIGEEALLSADIAIGTIIINGKVTGNIEATGKVEINGKGVVVGNIKTPTLIIDDGGIFDGHCDMNQRKKSDRDVSSGAEGEAPAEWK